MIHQSLKEELKDAMRAKDAVRLTVVRGLLTGFTNELITKGKKPHEELPDEEALAVIKRQVKQRKDSIEQFRAGGREDLVESESAELALLEKYLPETMGLEQIREKALAKKSELGLSEKKDAGMLMKALMQDLKGQADGSDVKKVVDELLP